MAQQASCFPSSSSSSSFSYEWPYHVFLSFRGRDTRSGFTRNLCEALRRKGIRTFFDDQELQGGEEIAPALVKAIQDSKIAIVVFSVDYASSSFCLDELATIMEYVKGNGRLVLPVFYDVAPCDVRHQRGSYGEAMAKHEERFKHEKGKVQKWREALRQAADLSGEPFKPGNEYEYDFIQKIVTMISNKISCVALHIADHPVGLESPVREVNSLLNERFDGGVIMVGIYGTGGIGKTTLARAVYNSIADQFEGSCFLENVREKSEFGLELLQKTLLSEVLPGVDINIGSANRGTEIIKQRLSKKKVLLVLDDVANLNQLQLIVYGTDWLGSGSRVIITTRDKHLLTSHGIERNYKVKGLCEKEALDLLGWYAFKGETIDLSYMDILKHAVTYACGLPLALEVIGSNLAGKSVKECMSLLAEYEKIPPEKIQKILEISFKALEKCHRKIFLDIACCFNGYDWPNFERILRARHRDVSLENGIAMLVQKSLVKINKFGRVKLHDLIRDMGREIVRQESPKPYERSRLTLPNDIVRILEDDLGTDNIEIMILDPPTSEEPKEVEWDGEAFKKMKNLEILIIRHACFSQGANHLPNSLRVLEWWNYPSNSLPSKFHPMELAIFDLQSSRLMSIKFVEKRKFMNLTSLNLGGSEIEQVPDLSNVPNLETLSFEGCMNLIKVHESVGFLNKLCYLRAPDCSKLKSFPALVLPCLKELNFSRCTSIEHVPDLSGVPNLEELSFNDCENLTKVHGSVGFLKKLRNLWASDCLKLKSFPALMLPSLENLGLCGCSSLENFPEILGDMEGIRRIVCENTSIKELPSSIANLSNLASMTMDVSGMLRLPNSIATLPYLGHLRIRSPGGLQVTKQEEDEGKGSSMVSTNMTVFLVRCNVPDESIRILLAWFCNVVELHLQGNDFTILPESIKELCSLRELFLDDCKKLTEIRGIPPNIRRLCAANCISLTPLCRSMLVNEEYHSSHEYRRFHLPGSSIPEWFENSSTDSISFWFRNNIPSVSVCVVLGADTSGDTFIWPMSIINGNGPNGGGGSRTAGLIHVADHISILDCKNFLACDELLSENEWNHVVLRVTCSRMKEFGIHVHKHESNTEDIRFIEPRGDLDPIKLIQATDVDPSSAAPATQLGGEPTLLCRHYECWGKRSSHTEREIEETEGVNWKREEAAAGPSWVKQEIPQNPNEAFHHEEEEEAGEEEEEEEEQEGGGGGGNDDHKNPTFVPGPLLPLKDQINRDKEDESLRTWKENDRDTRYGKVYKRRRTSRAE